MHDDGFFDERVAARYDASSAEMFEPEVLDPAVDLLEGHARGGAALELGIGTGRIALPPAPQAFQRGSSPGWGRWTGGGTALSDDLYPRLDGRIRPHIRQ